MTIEQARREAKQQLSPRRYRHTKNVAAAAVQLAQRWGASAEKAELAAWLHDITKERSREELLQILGQDAIMAGCTAQRPQPVWHGPAAAIYAKHHYGVGDAEVLDAIACHTTGRPGMTLLDKVLFLADGTSAERSFEGAKEIRELATQDLNAAAMLAMEENIRYLKAKGKTLDDDTLKALQYLKAQRQGKPKNPK